MDDSFRDRISTVDKAGKRLWVFPKMPKGKYTNARTWVSVFLLFLMFTGPFVRINGEPLLMLNVLERKFVLFGLLFSPQDFYIFALATVTFIVFIVLFTVIYGRIFCGWVCPQTIFMEMVFRKIEYWIEGDAKEQRQLDSAPWTTDKILKKGTKQVVFFIISFLIANTFLAYVIGTDALGEIIFDSPQNHLGGLSTLLVFTLAFYWIFASFREQVCTNVCPYGRLQGVLLDRNSLVVAYDHVRGESRGKIKRGEDRVEAGKGDCIDCKLCVDVCPTGIDIRNGTQLECINCTACMDACDFVMVKTGKPSGLIRIDSEEGIAQKKPFTFTKRMMAYTSVLVVLIAFLAFVMVSRTEVQTSILRTPGMMYQELPNGHISNLYNYKVINKSNQSKPLEFVPVNFEGEIKFVGNAGMTVDRQGVMSGAMFISMDKKDVNETKTKLIIGVYSEGKLLEKVKTTFLGPVN